MCAFFPLLLLVAIAPWPLGAPSWLSVTVDLAVLAVILWFWRAVTRPVTDVGGVPLDRLAGHPCPQCGATDTSIWRQGSLPVGLKCGACGQRSGADALRRALDGVGEAHKG